MTNAAAAAVFTARSSIRLMAASIAFTSFKIGAYLPARAIFGIGFASLASQS
jgi:hypothetical protein